MLQEDIARSIEEWISVSQSDFLSALDSLKPIHVHLKHKVLAQCCHSLGHEGLFDLLRKRNTELKLEVKNNVPDPIRKATEKGFAKVFTEQSLLILKDMGFELNNIRYIAVNQKSYLASLAFLIKKKKRNEESSKPATVTSFTKHLKNMERETKSHGLLEAKLMKPSDSQITMNPEEENPEIQRLQKELASLQFAHEQLLSQVQELKSHPIHPMRWLLLKSKNSHLERYIHTFHKEKTMDHDYLQNLANGLLEMKHMIQQDTPKKKLIQQMDRLSRWVNQSPVRIQDRLETMDLSERTFPLRSIQDWIHCPHKNISMADLCGSGTDFVNLQHIGRLEHELQVLYGDLLELKMVFSDNSGLQDRLKHQLESILLHLSSLAVLVPSATYPNLTQVHRTGYPTIPSVEELMQKLPKMSSALKREVQTLFEHLIKVMTLTQNMQMNEISCLEKELVLQKSLQIKNIQTSQSSAQTLIEANKKQAKTLSSIHTIVRDLSIYLESLDHSELLNFVEKVELSLDQLKHLLSQSDSN